MTTAAGHVAAALQLLGEADIAAHDGDPAAVGYAACASAHFDAARLHLAAVGLPVEMGIDDTAEDPADLRLLEAVDAVREAFR